MIVLKANPELKNTFDKLIKTMGVSVNWDGSLFAVIDNYLILAGKVRSLFFHFDSRKAVENIIDLPIKEDEIYDTAQDIRVRNVLNIILYAFGKWGAIKGLKVDKDYSQLNRMFSQIMKEFYIDTEYTKDYFRFYKEGIRITYEDVIQAAIEAADKVEELPEDEEVSGLWHKIVWSAASAAFRRVETNLAERQKGRIGNNFYMVGYLCPKCLQKLHMAVYPQGQEFKIETGDGAVLLARACTCGTCGCFYTPKPGKMLGEGDIYMMDFEGDKKAYEDYLELLGKKGDRVSNYRFNEYEAARRQAADGMQEKQAELETLCEDLSGYSDEDFGMLTDMVEEGFFPDESVMECEKKIKEHSAKRRRTGKNAENEGYEQNQQVRSRKEQTSPEHGGKPQDTGVSYSKKQEPQGGSGMKENLASGGTGGAGQKERSSGRKESRNSQGASAQEGEETPSRRKTDTIQKKYEARMLVIDRLSDRQLKELKSHLEHETKLSPEIKDTYAKQVEHALNQGRTQQLAQKVQSCMGKNFAAMKKVYDDIEREELPEAMKRPLLEQLNGWKLAQGEAEVRQLMEKMPKNLDRTGYKRFVERLKDYEGIDLTPYEAQLNSSRQRAEQQEIAGIVRRARKNSRRDLAELVKKLREGEFLPEQTQPYLEKLEGKIRQMDEEVLADITGDAVHMSFEEGMEAYERIQQGDFLPELKNNALLMMEKRLTKIKTDECELLGKKLAQELTEAELSENPKHYFYPARKVLLKQALPKETEVIDFAMASYAAGCGKFEYPVFVVDTSRNGTGKEGMILTPDHLYYSTLLNAYGIKTADIGKITASTGLLNKGLYVHQKNGTKTKIPYAVETKELSAYAGVLNDFVHYLQEKPESRKVDYLAQEKHETICCFRCGYVYKGGNICPKCGYKNNE